MSKDEASSELCLRLKNRLKKSRFWSDRSKESGSYLQNLVCPECGRREAWAYSKAPFSINCNRKNECGARTKTLELFPEVIERIETEYPAKKDDPLRPAREYLHSRGLASSLIGLKYQYWKNIRKSGSGGVMFSVGFDAAGKEVWNGRLFNPPQGGGKTHNQGSIQGMFWKHPGIAYKPDEPTYVTEGIIDALSLIEMGYQAIAVLSSGQDPGMVEPAELAGNIVIAFDADSAGAGGLKKWKAAFPESDAITPINGDWNDLLCSMSRDEAAAWFQENQGELRLRAKLLLAETAQDYAETFRDFYGRAAGLFEFDRCYHFSFIRAETAKRPEELVTYRVSNFTLDVRHYQLDSSVEDEPVNTYHLKIRPKVGRPTSCSVAGSELAAPLTLRSTLLTRARVLWEGDIRPSIALAKRIVEARAPVVRQLQILGHDLESGYFIFKDFAVDPAGKLILPDKNRFYRISHHEYLRSSAQASLKPKAGLEPATLYLLIHSAWPDNGPLAVAYTVSSWFVNIVKPELGFFPFLSLHGETQTGKTRLTRILNAMQCLDEEGLPMTKLNTGKGEIRKLAQRSGLFKALLEGNREERIRFDFDSLLTLYNFGNHLQVRALKTNDIQTHETRFHSSLIFVQNREPFQTKAQMERVISCRAFSAEQLTPETSKAFGELTRIPLREIAYFFVQVMKHRPWIEENWLIEHQKAQSEILREVNDNRLAENHAILLAFHRMLCRILKIDHDIKPFIIEIAQRKHEQCLHRQASMADLFFESINELPDTATVSCLEMSAGFLYIKISLALKLLDQNGFKLRLSDIYRDLREHPAFVKSNHCHRGYFGSTSSQVSKVWVFDAQKI
jgi:hypothetical protein